MDQFMLDKYMYNKFFDEILQNQMLYYMYPSFEDMRALLLFNLGVCLFV